MQYTSGDVSKMMTYSPTINGIELQSCVSNVFPNGFTNKKNIAAKVYSFYFFFGDGECLRIFLDQIRVVTKRCHFSFA